MHINEFFPVWNQLDEEHRRALTQSAFLKCVKKGDVLHNGSADCTGLFAIRAGQLRAYILSEEGREITLYRLFERDICLFSASCMMNSIQFEISVQAEKDSEFYVIPPEAYKKVMQSSAPLSNYTSQLMAARFSDVMWLIEQILWKSQDKRLAAFLLEESTIENTLTLRITHEKIAAHLGTAREVITRLLKYLQSEGMLELSRGAVEIKNPRALSAYADK